MAGTPTSPLHGLARQEAGGVVEGGQAGRVGGVGGTADEGATLEVLAQAAHSTRSL